MDSGFRGDGRTKITGQRRHALGRLLSLLLLAVFCVAPTAHAIEGPEGKVRFNLPSDEFPKAILEFYHQSKIEVLFLANDSLSQIRRALAHPFHLIRPAPKPVRDTTIDS